MTDEPTRLDKIFAVKVALTKAVKQQAKAIVAAGGSATAKEPKENFIGVSEVVDKWLKGKARLGTINDTKLEIVHNLVQREGFELDDLRDREGGLPSLKQKLLPLASEAARVAQGGSLSDEAEETTTRRVDRSGRGRRNTRGTQSR